MATTYNRRCGLCGQFQICEDREALLEDERFEWDESLVDDFIAGNRHLCVDGDPFGARSSARLAGAGLIVPELRWLIEAELERRQAAGPPAWAVFTGSITLIAMVVAGPRPRAAAFCASSDAPRPVQSRACDHVLAGCTGRSPPRLRAYRSLPTFHRSRRSP